ncbi:MAG: 3-deoxy-manno-octulosonate cytidylyltransferase [Planctomycetales bacterium]
MSSYVIIPARTASTRLPRKLLLRDTGKSVLQHTYEAAQTAASPLGVCVAAGDDEVAKDVVRFGGLVVKTSCDLESGTDRVAEVARDQRYARMDFIVNLQGDEPEITGEAIDQVVGILERDPQAMMATLAAPIQNVDQYHDPSCVKVVCDSKGRALYFSRSPIPHCRATRSPNVHEDALQHIGLYAYRREFLLKLTRLPQSRLEKSEKLEQLRVLESGFPIAVGLVDKAAQGIDTEADYRAFVQRQMSA